MSALPDKKHTEAVVARLDRAIERAEIVQTLVRVDDRIYSLKQSGAPAGDIELLERTAKSLQRRLDALRQESGE